MTDQQPAAQAPLPALSDEPMACASVTDCEVDTAQTCRPCSAICADGSICRAWAVRGSDPPRCAPHGGGTARVGAPKANQNARKHGYYATLTAPSGPRRRPRHRSGDVLAEYAVKHLRLVAYIDEKKTCLSVSELAPLFDLYTSSLSRVSRLMARYCGSSVDADTDFTAILARLVRQQTSATLPDP